MKIHPRQDGEEGGEIGGECHLGSPEALCPPHASKHHIGKGHPDLHTRTCKWQHCCVWQRQAQARPAKIRGGHVQIVEYDGMSGVPPIAGQSRRHTE